MCTNCQSSEIIALLAWQAMPPPRLEWFWLTAASFNWGRRDAIFLRCQKNSTLLHLQIRILVLRNKYAGSWLNRYTLVSLELFLRCPSTPLSKIQENLNPAHECGHETTRGQHRRPVKLLRQGPRASEAPYLTQRQLRDLTAKVATYWWRTAHTQSHCAVSQAIEN